MSDLNRYGMLYSERYMTRKQELMKLTRRYSSLATLERRMKAKGHNTEFITKIREEAERTLLQTRKGRG